MKYKLLKFWDVRKKVLITALVLLVVVAGVYGCDKGLDFLVQYSEVPTYKAATGQ